MSKMKKYLLTGISYVLVAALAIGGTFAYLQDTDEDVNVMTLGNVQIEQIEHRLSMRRNGGVTILDDAYNSNPAGAKMALEVLRDFNRKEGSRRIVVTPGFVEMGESQERNNRQLGRNIAESADWAFVVNKVNRDAIVQGLQDREFAAERIVVADSFAEASAKLAQMMQAGDIVLYENDLPDSFK